MNFSDWDAVIKASSPSSRNVVVMKWGTLYPADYVNVLFNACRRHIDGAFRFICLTDNVEGILPEVTCLTIPDIGLSKDNLYTKAVWPKLALFHPQLNQISGRFLFIDLDMLIVGPLDDFFHYKSGLVCTDMGEGWRPGYPKARPEAGTCIFAFDAGSEPQILERFLQDPHAAMKSFHNEQDFVGAAAKCVEYWPPGWVISFKRFLRQPIGLDIFRAPKQPMADARVVAFHGDPRPIELIDDKAGFWDRFPHLGNGAVPWMKDYWRAHGGRLPGHRSD